MPYQMREKAAVAEYNEVPESTGSFALLQEQPPASLFRRFFTTQVHLLGLAGGGGFAYLRSKAARGEDSGLQYWLLRIVLGLLWPLLDKEMIALPFPVQFRR